MDTRRKILTAAAARDLHPPGPVAMVSGTFDILRAEHAREIASVRNRTGARSLVAVVLPARGELLNQRARTELAAALRMVDYVVTADDGDLEQLVASLQPAELVRLESDDARRTRQLIENVHRRKIR
jgi:bifunctional ADP-heptose synthase (sugar kinase/adenylyltransferase)